MLENAMLKVTAAIIIEEGRTLIAERPAGGRHPGAWEFPGGKVEPGETPEECLARELKEELGIEVEVVEKLAEVVHNYDDATVELMAFRCAITKGTPQNLGCSAHEFVPLERLEEYDLLPPDRELARRILRSG